MHQVEEFNVKGDDLLGRIRELIAEGNVRRVTIKNAKVVKVDADRNLLFLKGGIPGARNSYIRIVKVS